MPYDLPRVPLPTGASSSDLARLPSELRRQALFSARLNRLEPVAEIGASIKGILDGQLSDSEARTNIRSVLAATGYRPPAGREGGLLDHTSRTRLDLILTQNVRAARGYGKWAADMDPDLLDVWPAQELVRVMARKAPRGDWQTRWEEAGGTLVEGRMAALKTSPVWASLSRFGQPFPPYDYGSGMGVRDVRRDEAERLGLIGPDDTLTPEPVPFPDMAEARMPDLAGMDALQASILKVFGEGASFDGGSLTLAPKLGVPATGDAASLRLGPLGAATVKPAPPLVGPKEARGLVSSGQANAKAPDGTVVRFSGDVEAHWRRKKYTDAAVDARLAHIRHAFAAVREPQEVWEREGSRWYLREFEPGADGRRLRILVQTRVDGEALTWIPVNQKPGYFERKRTGTLLTKEGAL
jgi:hypothetical protein